MSLNNQHFSACLHMLYQTHLYIKDGTETRTTLYLDCFPVVDSDNKL